MALLDWMAPEAGLRLEAERAGLSLSRLAAERAVAVDRVPVTVRNAERQLLLRVLRQLSGAATNLNQATKVGNATGRLPEEIGEAAATVARLEGELAEALGRIGR